MGVESAVPSVHGGALGAPYVCRRGLLSSSARQRRAPAVAVLMLLLCELVLLACRLPCRAAAAGREWTAPPEEDSARAAFAKPGVAGKAGFFELAPGYTEAKLLKDFTSCSRTHNLRMKYRQKRWEMYCSIAMLVERGVIPSSAKAANRFKKLDVNRGQLDQVIAMLASGPLPMERPDGLRAGRRGAQAAGPDLVEHD
ncbi:unnamed protein product [Prorocentrum cordatum]|uniref:Uncharacterized protein n=1 Tax=Prorocentrum cordatum TaxID=2364126 RepID=A0ABN9TB90_9DINO|nr:unnamed protein product [Polarella glacialis]